MSSIGCYTQVAMKTATLLSVPLLGLLLCFANGCAGDTSSNDPGTPGDEEDLKGKISQDLVCAAKAAAEESSDGSGLVGVDVKDLEGEAKSDFKAWQKGMVSDYPSEAFELPVKLKNKTYTFWLVVETNDGGGSMGIYKTTDGSSVATESSGESSPFTWSAPANKCKD